MGKSIIVNTDEIQRYIKDIRKIPIISHERQTEIFKRLSDETISETETKKLYDELCVGNLRFVITIAKNYQGQGLDIMDLISEGNIGLIKAAKRFDLKRDLKFISYAVWWIRQSIKASLNENARTIRLPSNVVQEFQKEKRKNPIENERESIEGTDNSLTTDLPYCVGLFSQINDDGDELIDLIPDVNSISPDAGLDTKEEIRRKVSMMLQVLDDREKTIIEKYFGFSGSESSNLEDLGEEFGCTKERIRQIRDKAIKKLRNESFSLLKYL